MYRIIPYLLPLLTFFIIGSIVFVDPTFTGSVVRSEGFPVVTLRTFDGYFLPVDAFVVVSVDEEDRQMRVDEFIQKSGGFFELTRDGYTGTHRYQVSLHDFGFSSVDRVHEIFVRIVHRERVLSSSKQSFS